MRRDVLQAVLLTHQCVCVCMVGRVTCGARYVAESDSVGLGQDRDSAFQHFERES